MALETQGEMAIAHDAVDAVDGLGTRGGLRACGMLHSYGLLWT